MSVHRKIMLCSSLALLVALQLDCYITVKTDQASAPGTGGTSPTRSRITPEDQVETAYHEAAHACVNKATGLPRKAERLVVFSKIATNGVMGQVEWDAEAPENGDPARLRALAMVHDAGHAVEAVLGYTKAGEPPRSDDPDADGSVFKALGYCEAAACTCPPEILFQGRCRLDGWMKMQRPLFYEAARRCVQANLPAIMDLARLVLKKSENRSDFERALDEDELDDFFAKHPLNTKACTDPPLTETKPVTASAPPI